MPVETRNQSRRNRRRSTQNIATMALPFAPDAFMIHLLKIVGFDHATTPTHPVFLSLARGGYLRSSDLFNLNERETQTLTFIDSSIQPPVITPLNRGYQVRLLAINAYRNDFQATNQRSMTQQDWLALDENAMDTFIMAGRVLSTPTPIVAPVSVSAPRQNHAVESFRKTLRRDPSHFKAFSDKRLWASWKLQFEATARAQDLTQLLDPAYTPLTPEDREVFEAKQQYLYAVFVQTLLTDEGKTYVRKHISDFDAQAIYQELCRFHGSSMYSEITASSIMSFLTSFRLGSQPWMGKTTVSFLTYFLEQLRLYDEIMLTSSSPVLHDGFKLTMLDMAVQGIEDLRQVRITYNTLCLQLQQPGSFSMYFDLLHKAATVYDAQQQSRSSSRSQESRKVYGTFMQTDEAHYYDAQDYDHAPYDESYDDDPLGSTYDSTVNIDTPLSSINVYAAQQQRRSTRFGNNVGSPRGPPDPALRLPDAVFSKLSRDDKAAWFKLGPDARRMILGLSSSSSSRPGPLGNSLPGISSVDRRVLFVDSQTPATTDDLAPDPPKVEEVEALATTSYLTKRSPPHPGDLRRLLSASEARAIDNRTINMAVTYSLAKSNSQKTVTGALIDRGANGGLAGADCRIIAHNPDCFVNVEGIDRHQLTNIPIVSCGAYSVTRNHGPVILIFHQLAGIQKGHTILSAGQLEAYYNKVNERSRRFDPKGQLITTNDGFELPLHIRNGLPYLDMRPYTDREWDTLPHVVMTSDVNWDPSTLDGEFPAADPPATLDASTYDNGTNFDAYGNYRLGTIVSSANVLRDDPVLQTTVLPDEMLVEQQFSDDDGKDEPETYDAPEEPVPPEPPPPAHHLIDLTSERDDEHPTYVNVSPHLSASKVDPSQLRQFFAFLPTDVVSRTLARTTQYARVPMSDAFKRFYKSPFPALNVARRAEDLLTDIIYSDTPAIDDGSTSAAIYSGRLSHVLDVFGMKTDAQFVNTLEDIIRERGAPSRLLSDSAIVIRSSRVKDILRALYIGQWTSEPHRQHQNVMERRYQTAKRLTNLLLDRSGCPPSCWLLCLQYVCTVLNCTACQSLNWSIPLTVLLGVTIDVSPLLRFHWFQPVFYAVDDVSFPSSSKEALGYFVGISTNCGHAMTFKILTDDTHRVIMRSQVRPADDPTRPNLRLTDLFDGEPPSKVFVRSKFDPDKASDYPNLDPTTGEVEQVTKTTMIPVDTSELVDTNELVGRTFLLDQQEDGTIHRARIVDMIHDHEYELSKNPEHIKFKLSVNNDKYEELMTYGEVLNHINKDTEQEVLWRYKKISGHQGPLTSRDKDYKGSAYNVLVEWENGEISYEPLKVIMADDPITCAIYARENGLLDTPGWKTLKKWGRRDKVLQRQANQAKLRSFNTAPRFKYGFELPKNFEHALFLDNRNGNTKWQDANDLEFGQLFEYKTFIDLGHFKEVKAPTGYKKIRVHLVFDVKHDGRHKVRVVADGHLTDIPVDSVYSGVVSLRGLRIMLFLAELNDLEVWATDIGNAYLEAKTQEKLYIIAGPEFGKLHGHILIIDKALYGLRSSGKRWHERFADCLRKEGFESCKIEPDLWIRPAEDKSCYEMIAVYVDDLAFGMKDPKKFLSVLENKYQFKLKGSGSISFHLGCDFERDTDGTLCMVPKQYINRLVSQYERMFGCKPKTNVSSPIEKGDHPETDTTDLLDAEGIQQYQSLIGSLQWAVSLGRLDITTAVMTMSSFRSLPRVGHLDRVKRIVSYLYRFNKAKIRFRTHEPDFSDLAVPKYDWADSTYGPVTEEVPRDIPAPLGKPVVTVSYIDANLMHDLTTGKSVTGILHFLNGTPIEWYSKKISTVETATYGAEFASARTCVEQLVDLRLTLRYLGVPLREKSYMFGDNESVVNSSFNPHAKLHKRHNVLSFHRVREAIASGKYVFTHIAGENNPADILSKHWGYSQVWHMLRTLLFHEGETIDSPGKDFYNDKDKDGFSSKREKGRKQLDEGKRRMVAVGLGSSSKNRAHSPTTPYRVPDQESMGQKASKVHVYRCTSRLGSINFPSSVLG